MTWNVVIMYFSFATGLFLSNDSFEFEGTYNDAINKAIEVASKQAKAFKLVIVRNELGQVGHVMNFK